MQRRKIIKLAAAGSVLVTAAGATGLLRAFSSKDNTSMDAHPLANIVNNGQLTPTSACGKQPTVTQTAGPFFSANSPKRISLREADIVGLPLLLEGVVMDTKCHPIAGAVLDFWSCDGNGEYDNQGFKLRGHQYTDKFGRYRLQTVRPANYGNAFFQRTAHIHVKVQGKETALLTTQLYFPDDPMNAKDSIFNSALLVDLDASDKQQLRARFDFVIT